MSVTEELFELIDAPTVGIVASRIYVPEAPANYTYQGPFVVISVVGGSSEEDLTGGIGLATERFEFSCRASADDGGNKVCRQIADLIRIAVQGVAPSDTALISDASFAGRGPDLYDDVLNVHIVPIDFEVVYHQQSTNVT